MFLTMGTFFPGQADAATPQSREETVIFPWDPTIQAAEMRNGEDGTRAGPRSY